MPVQTVLYSTHAEAASAISGKAQAHILGGGTLLMRAVNEADPAVGLLVQIERPNNRLIRSEGNHLILGAGVTMTDILRSNDSVFLHSAARLVGGPAIRNMATVGGNLFAPSPYGDMATALLALDAEVKVVIDESGSTGDQWIPLQQLLATRDSAVHPIVIEIRCSRPASPDDFRFLKVSRVKPKGISVITIAAHLPGASGAVLNNVRIAYGAMASTPIRVSSVEQCLEGQRLDESSISAALLNAVVGLSPPTDAIASSWYRQTVAPVHLGRLLRGQHKGVRT